MDIALIVDILLKVIGGLGIFLLGMKNMSEGMQAIAGDRLRKMIAAVTGNRLAACGVGTAVTTVVQSSSIATVMVVGFVSAGLMTLTQAIGVIMGANIGTTITGWILVLKVGKWGLPILGIAALVYLFSKNERLRFTGMAIMGFGGGAMITSPLSVTLMNAFQSDTSIGVAQTFLVMGLIYFCFMMLVFLQYEYLTSIGNLRNGPLLKQIKII